LFVGSVDELTLYHRGPSFLLAGRPSKAYVQATSCLPLAVPSLAPVAFLSRATTLTKRDAGNEEISAHREAARALCAIAPLFWLSGSMGKKLGRLLRVGSPFSKWLFFTNSSKMLHKLNYTPARLTLT
ncbi:unnamed protein product, partial [Amoebophrya sp. A120]